MHYSGLAEAEFVAKIIGLQCIQNAMKSHALFQAFSNLNDFLLPEKLGPVNFLVV
jgi:hypothetical protein